MFFSFPRWFAPSVDGQVLPDTPENLFVQGRFTKVPFIVGQTKDEGAFFYRLVMNSFSNGVYDDNFIDHKLPRSQPQAAFTLAKVFLCNRSAKSGTFSLP
jgi:carboxylesterase type B